MIFKDLINSVNYDDVWVELRKGHKLKKSAYEVYKRVVDEFGLIRITKYFNS